MAAAPAPRVVRAFMNLGFVLKDEVLEMFKECGKFGPCDAFIVGRSSPLRLSLGADCYVEVKIQDRMKTFPLLKTIKEVNDKKLLYNGNKRVGLITFVSIDADAWILPQLERFVAAGEDDRAVFGGIAQLLDGPARDIAGTLSQVPTTIVETLDRSHVSLLQAIEHHAATAPAPASPDVSLAADTPPVPATDVPDTPRDVTHPENLDGPPAPAHTAL